ncbi:hypothetical protein [Marinobacter nauticus]|uniref:hypothetical protein n=1 Tax=Marinobacter nauticus TaxID=2743 RepID=UPI000F1345F3|nr:hypothetical protein [Marinobacter nauticus]RKR78200.1 hypothetical protein C7436_1914 [Marinobacter nauticus]
MSWFKMFSAVLVANIVSWVIVTIIGWLVFFVFMDALGDEFERRMSSGPKIEFPQITTPPPPTPQEIQARKERERQLAADRKWKERQAQQKQAAIAGARENCNFWRTQYQKDNDPKSRAYRDMACTRLQSYLSQ